MAADVNPEGESFEKRATRAAYGWGRQQSWSDAVALLRQAAEAGEDQAERQLALVTSKPIEELLALPRVERQSTIAPVGACRGFAPPGFSEWLIDRAAERLVHSEVNDIGSAGVFRTSRDAAFTPRDRDVVLAIMQERAARLVGVPVAYHEAPHVISYEPGQEFGMHVDFVDPRVAEYADELRVLGQRTATILTYLNEDFEGAETVFPQANVKFRGATGDALVWSNVRPDGSPDENTRHAGLSPISGRKWVFSQWVRSNPFPHRPEDLV
jgi:prolyl 4-hydroxylase